MDAPPGGVVSTSVIVCAYTLDRLAVLVDAVDSLRAQSHRADELIIVCDHNDALAERVRELIPDARVIANDGAPGLAEARNSGVRAAHGTIVAFLDDDALAAPDWLAMLLRGFASPAILGVGGPVTPRFAQRRPAWLPREFDWVIGCSYLGQRTTPGPIRNLIGANMSFRRASLLEIGGFDPGLGRRGDNGLGCEETDLCLRLTRHSNAEIRFEPAAKVVHVIAEDRTRVSYFLRRCRAEGRSKRVLTRRAGAGSGLATERTYVRQTLPAAVLRGLAAGARGDVGALARAGMVVTGLGATMLGFAAEVRAGS